MAYELLPGVRQDHKGQLYQLGRYPNGKLINVPYLEVQQRPAWLEPCTVESKGKPGTYYNSVVFFQGGTI